MVHFDVLAFDHGAIAQEVAPGHLELEKRACINHKVGCYPWWEGGGRESMGVEMGKKSKGKKIFDYILLLVIP